MIRSTPHYQSYKSDYPEFTRASGVSIIEWIDSFNSWVDMSNFDPEMFFVLLCNKMTEQEVHSRLIALPLARGCTTNRDAGHFIAALDYCVEFYSVRPAAAQVNRDLHRKLQQRSEEHVSDFLERLRRSFYYTYPGENIHTREHHEQVISHLDPDLQIGAREWTFLPVGSPSPSRVNGTLVQRYIRSWDDFTRGIEELESKRTEKQIADGIEHRMRAHEANLVATPHSIHTDMVESCNVYQGTYDMSIADRVRQAKSSKDRRTTLKLNPLYSSVAPSPALVRANAARNTVMGRSRQFANADAPSTTPSTYQAGPPRGFAPSDRTTTSRVSRPARSSSKRARSARRDGPASAPSQPRPSSAVKREPSSSSQSQSTYTGRCIDCAGPHSWEYCSRNKDSRMPNHSTQAEKYRGKGANPKASDAEVKAALLEHRISALGYDAAQKSAAPPAAAAAKPVAATARSVHTSNHGGTDYRVACQLGPVHSIAGLLDSGSHVTLMDSKFYHQHSPELGPLEQGFTIPVRAADGQIMPILGTLHLPLTMCDAPRNVHYTRTVAVHIADGVDIELLIGSDVTKQFLSSLNYTTGELVFLPTLIPDEGATDLDLPDVRARIHCAQNVVLAPGSLRMIDVDCRLDLFNADHSQIVCEPVPITNRHDRTILLSFPAVMSGPGHRGNGRGHFRMVIANPTLTTITLRAGVVIGCATTLTSGYRTLPRAIPSGTPTAALPVVQYVHAVRNSAPRPPSALATIFGRWTFVDCGKAVTLIPVPIDITDPEQIDAFVHSSRHSNEFNELPSEEQVAELSLTHTLHVRTRPAGPVRSARRGLCLSVHQAGEILLRHHDTTPVASIPTQEWDELMRVRKLSSSTFPGPWHVTVDGTVTTSTPLATGLDARFTQEWVRRVALRNPTNSHHSHARLAHLLGEYTVHTTVSPIHTRPFIASVDPSSAATPGGHRVLMLSAATHQTSSSASSAPVCATIPDVSVAAGVPAPVTSAAGTAPHLAAPSLERRFVINDKLTPDQQKWLLLELNTMLDAFATDPRAGPVAAVGVEHAIHLTDEHPLKQNAYRQSPDKSAATHDQIEALLARGLIVASSSPWSSPIVLVKKGDGSWRMCIDYRKLNARTKKDAYPIPLIDDCLNVCKSANWFTLVDVKEAFHHIPLDPRSRMFTAFVTDRGLFEFTRMPFGLSNAPATFQRYIDMVLRDYRLYCIAFFDDILVFTTGSLEDHWVHVRAVLDRLHEFGLEANIDKCHFAYPEMLFVGHVVSHGIIKPDPAKLLAVTEWAQPTNIHQLRTFIGFVNYYRRFVPGFAVTASPLFQLFKKDAPWEWSARADRAFHDLKTALTVSPCLHAPDFTRPFIIQTDACGDGIGAVLTQLDHSVTPPAEHPVGYISRQLSEAERKWTVTEWELLAIVYALSQFEQYVIGTEFTVQTDHSPLIWLESNKMTNSRIGRWAMKLAPFSPGMKIVGRPGTANGNADALSRAPRANSAPVDVADDDSPALVPGDIQPHFLRSNYIAHCPFPSVGRVWQSSAAIYAIEHSSAATAAAAATSAVVRHAASSSAAMQIDSSAPLGIAVERSAPSSSSSSSRTVLLGSVNRVTVEDPFPSSDALASRPARKSSSSSAAGRPPAAHSSRTHKRTAASQPPPASQSTLIDSPFDGPVDLQSGVGSAAADDTDDGPISSFTIIDLSKIERLIHEQRNDATLKPIIDYIETKQVQASLDSIASKAMIKSTRNFIMIAQPNDKPPGLFYAPSAPAAGLASLKQCQPRLVIPKSLQPTMIALFHDPPSMGHLGMERTVRRLSVNYYWGSLWNDVNAYINACEPCQREKVQRTRTQTPPGLIAVPTRPWELISIDFIGPLDPVSEDFKYVLVIIDHYTRFAIAVPTQNQEAATVAMALVDEVFNRYGVPTRLLSDRGMNFRSQLIEHLHTGLHIKKLFTSAHHPQTNGMVERLNGTLKSMLRALSYQYTTRWAQILQSAVFAYNTSVSAATGYTPYYLNHGREAITIGDALLVAAASGDRDADPTNLEPFVQDLVTNLGSAYQFVDQMFDLKVNDNIDARSKYARIPVYSVGDLVMIMDHRADSRVGGGPSAVTQWRGPYTVVHVNNEKSYVCRPPGKGQCTTVNVANMKRFVGKTVRPSTTSSSAINPDHIAAVVPAGTPAAASSSSIPYHPVDRTHPSRAANAPPTTSSGVRIPSVHHRTGIAMADPDSSMNPYVDETAADLVDDDVLFEHDRQPVNQSRISTHPVDVAPVSLSEQPAGHKRRRLDGSTVTSRDVDDPTSSPSPDLVMTDPSRHQPRLNYNESIAARSTAHEMQRRYSLPQWSRAVTSDSATSLLHSIPFTREVTGF